MLTENCSTSSSDKKSLSDSNGQFNQSTPIYFTSTIVSPQTPVLFSTNRGLFLRKAQIGSTNLRNCDYELNFCDLERWSTNRANSICLNDTINSHTYLLSNQNRPSVRFSTLEHDISENFDQESVES